MIIFPAESTTHEETTRRGPKICWKSQFDIVVWVIFPADVTMYAEEILTTAEKSDRALRWQCVLG